MANFKWLDRKTITVIIGLLVFGVSSILIYSLSKNLYITVGMMVIVILTGSIIALRYKIKQRQVTKQNESYEQAMKDFERAEKLMQESKGKRTPHDILWQVYKEKDIDKEYQEEVKDLKQKPDINKLTRLFRR